MTNQEALKIVNVNGYGYPENKAAEAHKIIEREMGFRIQRAPRQGELKGTSLFGEASCPECGMRIYRTENYCSNCGQAIDWTEYEAEGRK